MKIKQAFISILTLLLSLNGNTYASGWDPYKIRGFMIDAPRGVETIDYYFRLIDFLHKKDFNTIIFRLTDDQGSAYLFKSHPELKMCEGAFTSEELKKMVRYAADRGIELIPEIESFGHSRYITETAQYQYLNDGPPGEDFNAISPVSEDAYSLLKDLYMEVASIFPGQYVHIGCDEVNWGAGELSKKALASASKSKIWAGYVNKLNRFLKTIDKTTMIWGDVPIYHEEDILGLLDKDMVILDWNYRQSDKAKIKSIADRVLDHGFKLIACPAVHWCEWSARVGASQFKNINAYAEVYAALNNPNSLGIILTNWVPTRYLQNSEWDTYAIAAAIVNNNGNYHYMDAIPAFVKDHFGAAYDANWETIFKTVYEGTFQTPACGKVDSLKFSPWSSAEDIRNVITKNRRIQKKLDEVIRLLTAYRGNVTSNRDDFEDFMLAIRYMHYNYNRQNALLDFVRSRKNDRASVKAYLKKVAAEDQAQLSSICAAWKRGRQYKPDEALKSCMSSFYKAAAYSGHLSENPKLFMEILNSK
ncbi:MAG: family 20 glycosylhydrolase [Chitinophagaceae bacterium]|nr:family 20 glycosylhydrolase [Chitinophagaceae bacterium]